MKKNTFKLPSEISNETLKKIINDLHYWYRDIPKDDVVVYFDYSKCSFISPAGVVLIAVYEDLLRESGKIIYPLIEEQSRIVAFLRNYGLISKIKMESIYEQSMQKYTVKLMRCMKSSESQIMSDQVLPHILKRTNCKKSTAAALSWGLWEVLDNAGNHGYQCYETLSYPYPVYTCAFSYKDRVEVAVMDRGAGVFNSLKKKHPILLAENALLTAIKKGVTGHPNGSPGFGLFGISELAKRSDGRFFMWSSDHGLKVRGMDTVSFQCSGTVGTLAAFSLASNLEAPYNDIIGGDHEDHFSDLNIGF